MSGFRLCRIQDTSIHPDPTQEHQPSAIMPKQSPKHKKPLFGKDGYQSGGPDTRKLQPLSQEQARAVGKALGRGPVPTLKTHK